VGRRFDEASRFEGWVPWGSYADASGADYSTEASSAARVVVNLSAMDHVFDRREVPALIRHELTHAITARVAPSPGAGFGLSRWVAEGYARFVEYAVDPSRRAAEFRQVKAGVARGWFTGTPPDSAHFYDKTKIGFNYSLSSTVFHFVGTQKGPAAATDFYAGAQQILDGATVGVPYLTSKAFDGVCRVVTGLSAKAFLAEWSSYVRSI